MAKIKKLATKNFAWVVGVDMGYGHQRPAHNLRHLAYQNQIIVANSYPGIPQSDKRIWKTSRKFYEFVSRFTHVPIIGPWVFSIFDRIQEIPSFYPRRDLSKPTIQIKQIYRFINRNCWGKHLIEKLAKNPLPLITTFFAIAFMAEEYNYPDEIYCIATDTDVTRAWAPKNPHQTRIKYFAPNYRVVERLKEYGIPEKNIHLTGFPLPMENIGGITMSTLRHDLANRLVNLDPKNNYVCNYGALVNKKLKLKNLPKESNHPLTLTFAVGGAGAQREIGALILASLRKKIKEKKIRLVLVAGIHNNVSAYFRQQIRKNGLIDQLDSDVVVIHAHTKEEYFDLFNEAMRVTDILWTKPSELSFYSALGIPIVMSPPIGSQEVFNQRWLQTLGVAAIQDRPEYTHEWLFDWINSGWCAEAAMQGFIEAPKCGTYNIEKIISRNPQATKKFKMTLQY